MSKQAHTGLTSMQGETINVPHTEIPMVPVASIHQDQPRTIATQLICYLGHGQALNKLRLVIGCPALNFPARPRTCFPYS